MPRDAQHTYVVSTRMIECDYLVFDKLASLSVSEATASHMNTHRNLMTSSLRELCSVPVLRPSGFHESSSAYTPRESLSDLSGSSSDDDDMNTSMYPQSVPASPHLQPRTLGVVHTSTAASEKKKDKAAPASTLGKLSLEHPNLATLAEEHNLSLSTDRQYKPTAQERRKHAPEARTKIATTPHRGATGNTAKSAETHTSPERGIVASSP